MKRLLILFVLVPIAAPESGGRAKRLEWVAWNPVEHILYWEVSEGQYDVHGQYEPGVGLLGTQLILHEPPCNMRVTLAPSCLRSQSGRTSSWMR